MSSPYIVNASIILQLSAIALTHFLHCSEILLYPWSIHHMG